METIIFTVLSDRTDQTDANFYVPKKEALEELRAFIDEEQDPWSDLVRVLQTIAGTDLFRDEEDEKLITKLKHLFQWKAEFDPSDSEEEEEEEEEDSEEEEAHDKKKPTKRIKIQIDWCRYESIPMEPIRVLEHIIFPVSIWG